LRRFIVPETAILILLFGVAFLGHFALMIGSHNFCYGQRLPRGASKPIHAVHALAILIPPVILYYATSCIDVRPLLIPASVGGWILAGYVAVCLGVGGLWVPYITLARWLRREPAVQISKTSRVVDLEKELGFRPVGTHESSLTYLPGNEVFTLELVERTLRLARLPRALDGLKILHLTDLHISGTPDRDWLRRVMELCQVWEPDLICLTGDVVETDSHQGWVMPTLGWLKARHGAFAILGNHDRWIDYPRTCQVLEQVGYRMLGGQSVQVEINGAPLVLVGHEGPWFKAVPDLKDCPEDVFRLCLSHTPDNFPWARANGIDLMLAGHVHGGQVRFPIIGSLLVPSKFGRRYDCGLFHEGPTVLFVGRGVAGDHPLRYLCRPEVTLLVLRCAEGTT
jgi:predicted MPP superfamily phosphohydrolase